jgi:hypothetical protein
LSRSPETVFGQLFFRKGQAALPLPQILALFPDLGRLP